LGAVVWLAAIGVAPTTAAARSDSFAGSCSLQGTTYFGHPVTPTAGPNSLATSATGACTGTLDGTKVTQAPVTVALKVQVYAGGCLYAYTTSPGDGTLAFADGDAIKFTFGFAGVLTEYPLTIRGEHSGSAHGLTSLLTLRTNPDVLLRCAGFDGGLSQTPVDVTFTTDTPLVSDGAPTPTGARTFSGKCSLAGLATFSPALTLSAQNVEQHAHASGTCSGTFIDSAGTRHQLSRSPVTFTETASATGASCAYGIASGRGALAFALGTVGGPFSETRIGPAVVISLRGDAGGSATAIAAVSPTESPVSILQECAAGGLDQVPITAVAVSAGISS
jgi:hypothetical protein